MSAVLEVWRPSGVESVSLEDERVTVGADRSNGVWIADDDTVSALHAVLESYGSGWAVRDLGSRNGTYLNGERVLAEQTLRDGDELRLGSTRLVFRDRGKPAAARGRTAALGGELRPDLTRRERDVLVALCRPLASSDPFPQPASIRAIATELVVTEAAVKQHLLHLYEKFGLHHRSENRRVRLANEVILRGMLTPTELRRDQAT
jgi:predicted component of type VI protein secretion system